MKNKILASITALCAALVLVGGFSVTAYAQTPTEETDDSGVIVETEPQPLTPEGNMTLVDDIDGDAAEDKQFIVVKSKGGNYFYIIVDRAAEGENSVHFLNQVDESDLMAIIGEEQTEQPPAVCNCTEKCKAGEVNTACPVCSVNMDSCTGKEAAPEEPTEQEQPQNGMGGLLIFLVVGLLGGGAALYYVKFMKPKQNVKGSTDLDEFDFDEYDEDEPEEETDIDLSLICFNTIKIIFYHLHHDTRQQEYRNQVRDYHQTIKCLRDAPEEPEIHRCTNDCNQGIHKHERFIYPCTKQKFNTSDTVKSPADDC